MAGTTVARGFSLTPLAWRGDMIEGFAPYVATLDERGTLFCQASLVGGGTGLISADEQGARLVARAEREAFVSHPSVDREGRVAIYAHGPGAERLLRIEGGRSRALAGTGGELVGIGPLGPTSDAGGAVAFRATTSRGPSIMVAGDEGLTTIAGAPRCRAFHGLPHVVAGRVAFRAEIEGDGAAVCLWRDGEGLSVVASAGSGFSELGAFVCLDERGGVTFAATWGGRQGLYRVEGGRVGCLVASGGALASVRGGVHGAATYAYAYDRGGGLLLLASVDGEPRRLLGVGDGLYGAQVVDMAMNPVSMNARGQLALRLSLSDGRELVARLERESAAG